MVIEHASGERLVLVGYVLYPKDIDSFMWDDFKEFEKCPVCGLRKDYFGHNPDYRPLKTSPDYGTTWDGEKIVSTRFKDFCESTGLSGIDYRPFNKSDSHFHARYSRLISLEQAISKPVLRKGTCEECGQSKGLHWEDPWTFKIQKPLGKGFWRSDIIVGWNDHKNPFIVVSPATRYELQNSGLTGFLSFNPVYAVSTPELEAALETYPPEKPKKVRSSTPKRVLPSRIDFEPLLRLKTPLAPGFLCHALGDEDLKARIPVRHEMCEKRPDEAMLKHAKELLGSGGRLLLQFYKYYNGGELYRALDSDEAGVRLFRIDQWETETKAMKAVFASMPEEERPEVLERAVAFGEPPYSGHHFAMVTRGRGVGSVLLTNHETLSADEFAPHFNEFLKAISTDPVDLLNNQLGGYTRYRDGKTKQEWIPEEYLENI